MADEFGDKTQEATPHRRQKAREEGQVAKSQDLASALVLLGTLLLLMWFGPQMSRTLGQLFVNQLGGPAWMRANPEFLVNTWWRVLLLVGAAVLPFLSLLTLTAIGSQLGQVGFLFLPQKLALDLSHVNPGKGLQRLFSLGNGMRLAFGIVKVAIVTTVAAISIWGDRYRILDATGLEFLEQSLFLVQTTLWTCVKMAVALLILAILDFGFQRWKYEQDLRMTTQEIREEFKQMQGDPQIMARRRQVQRQLVMNRLAAAIPKADVVVTNPTELAVAIQYDPRTMAAPIVLAKGAGVLAARIRQLALEHGVPIVERKPLAQALYRDVDVNRPIPSEQFAAVAEVLKYVYQLKGKTLP